MSSPHLIPIFRPLRSAAAAASLGLLTFNAHALFDDDEARRAILELRQKVDIQQTRNVEEIKKANEDNAQLRRSVLDLANQIELLRAELAKLRGQDEQLARDLADVQRKQKDMTQGVDDRLRKFEPSKVTVDGKEFVASPAEIRDFEAALAVIRRGEFAPAQTAFLDFLARYPNTGYKPAAFFWLGNAQYGLRGYKEAIANFKSVVALAPDGPRAAGRIRGSAGEPRISAWGSAACELSAAPR